MTGSTANLLLLLLALQAKHLLADFYLQTGYMLSGRDRYAHTGRALHCAVHIAFTLPILLLFGAPPAAALAIALAEFALHFHIDWGKSQVLSRRALTPTDATYWHVTGIDQALHHATYIGIAALWLWLLPAP